MRNAAEVVKLSAWTPKTVVIANIVNALTLFWLGCCAFLQADLLAARSISDSSTKHYLQVILKFGTLLTVTGALAVFCFGRWTGIALHYFTTAELDRLLRLSGWLCWIAAGAAVMQFLPLAHAVVVHHFGTILWAAVLAALQIGAAVIAWRTDHALSRRLLHIAEILRHEHRGSTQTIKALRQQTGPRSTLKSGTQSVAPRSSIGPRIPKKDND